MEFVAEDTADLTIVTVAGRLDSVAAVQFSGHLAELRHNGSTQLLIELSRLTYISSAGCRALFIAARQSAERGGRLALCGMTGAVKDVVELAGLAGQVGIYASRNEAVMQLSAA
ncbi:MAG TPA: STAS domain-containing protein [Acetobacteraceae bacterium]|nr:STAS domain-containing protein [Acetobacteraceae bacterium]